jgi:catechol 2,3-dioxygenase-like lactoylglutathione lyase family enzyme
MASSCSAARLAVPYDGTTKRPVTPSENRNGVIQAAMRLAPELGGTTVEVMCYPEAKAIPSRSAEQRLGWQCLALEVDDMDGALNLLKEKGVEAAWGPVKRPDYARAEIRDPDGNPIELRQWYRR